MRNSHVNQVHGNWDESANNEHDTFSDSDNLANDMELTGHKEHFCQEEDISLISSDFNNEWAEWHIDDDLSDTSDDQSLDGFLEDRLRCWPNDFQIKQNALDSLLKILKKSGHPTLPTLPSSARTLMKTARVVQIQQKSGMEYKYFPIARQLLKHFNTYPNAEIEATDTIQIALNVCMVMNSWCTMSIPWST